MNYELKPLGKNQPSYTIKQMTTLFEISRGELSKWVREGRFKGVGAIQGKLTGITDTTVFLTDLNEEIMVEELINAFRKRT